MLDDETLDDDFAELEDMLEEDWLEDEMLELDCTELEDLAELLEDKLEEDMLDDETLDDDFAELEEETEELLLAELLDAGDATGFIAMPEQRTSST